MADRNDWNRQTIEAFRANGGKVGGMWEGRPLLLLTTTGAKSGKQHTTPTMYLPDGNRLLVFASKAGAPTDPDWYRNLLAHPEVTVEVGPETYQATATVLTGEERDRLYAKQAELYPQFADYQQKTTRVIPVVALVGGLSNLAMITKGCGRYARSLTDFSGENFSVSMANTTE